MGAGMKNSACKTHRVCGGGFAGFSRAFCSGFTLERHSCHLPERSTSWRCALSGLHLTPTLSGYCAHHLMSESSIGLNNPPIVPVDCTSSLSPRLLRDLRNPPHPIHRQVPRMSHHSNTYLIHIKQKSATRPGESCEEQR